MYILTILYDTAADKGKILAYGNSPKREKCAPNSNLGGMEGPQALHLHSAVPALPVRGAIFSQGILPTRRKESLPCGLYARKISADIFSKTGPKMAAPIGNRHFDLLYSRLRRQADKK